jgi:mannose-6-phosphate isomerase-like protein (cupin superfamily)
VFLPSAAARELTLLTKRSVINYPLNLKISKPSAYRFCCFVWFVLVLINRGKYVNTVEVKAEILAALRETLSPRLHSTPVLRSFIDDFAACEITRPKVQAQAHAHGDLPDAVAEYLPDLMATMSVQPLAQMFKSYFPQISWYQIFRGNSTASAFNQGLVAAQLVGGNGLLHTETLYLGLFLLAPNITYPLHQHAATELYYVLSGSVAIRHGRFAEARHLGRDDFSVTAPHQVHELKTDKQPCLMAYVWTGDLTPQNWWWEQLGDGTWARICWTRTPAGDWSMLRREALSDAEISRAGDT